MLEVQALRLSGQLGQDLPVLKPYASGSRARQWAVVLGHGELLAPGGLGWDLAAASLSQAQTAGTAAL